MSTDIDMGDADTTDKQPAKEQQSSTTIPQPPPPIIDADDNASVNSSASSKSEERRRRRASWRREHENQLKVDGTFPRRNSTGNLGLPGSSDTDRKAVSERVIRHLGTKSTAKPSTLPPRQSDDVRVRSNLLRTLGIQKGGGANVLSPMMTQGKGSSGGQASGGGGRGHRRIQSAGGEVLGGPELVTGNTATSRSLLSNVRLKEELKYDSDEDVEPPGGYASSYNRFFGSRDTKVVEKQQPPKQPTNIPRRRRILFSDNVDVVPIPMRSEYSNRIKDRMYSGRVELSENAQRNVVEYEAEGWDATTVLDDENQFYKCPLTGELIHPVHLAYFNKGSEMKD